MDIRMKGTEINKGRRQKYRERKEELNERMKNKEWKTRSLEM
jgi:hypothetical protein